MSGNIPVLEPDGDMLTTMTSARANPHTHEHSHDAIAHSHPHTQICSTDTDGCPFLAAG